MALYWFLCMTGMPSCQTVVSRKSQLSPSITTFEFSEANLGKVVCGKSLKSEPVSSIILCNWESIPQGMPEELEPAGLSLVRQTYLYVNIRPHVPPHAKDMLCPKPSSSVPAGAAQEGAAAEPSGETVGVDDPTTAVIDPPRRQSPKCSYCQQTGHRNSTIRGVRTCPK